jgi:hypothetical protein
MTWTRCTWTEGLCAATALGFGQGGHVIADHRGSAASRRSGGHQVVARALASAPPRAPSPPRTRPRARARLSAPLHGTRRTWGKKGARGKLGASRPGEGGR